MYYSIVTTCDCSSELLERLLRSNRFGHLQHVEPYSLGEWSALSNGDQIPQVRITIVRFIFIDFTIPVRMRPRMLTLPVNGHFLSMYVPSTASRGVLKPKPTFSTNRCSFAFTALPTTRFLFRKMGACFWKALSVCSDMVLVVVLVFG